MIINLFFIKAIYHQITMEKYGLQNWLKKLKEENHQITKNMNC
jgi:hypothetical protein